MRGNNIVLDTLSNITDSNIYDAFDSFNKTSSKSYNITVAAGCCMLEPGSELSLAAAMAEADGQLYKVKRLRKKEVEKAT